MVINAEVEKIRVLINFSSAIGEKLGEEMEVKFFWVLSSFFVIW